jgi:chromosome segregation ATPase
MEPTDLTIEILKGIRDEIRQTNQRLDQTNEHLDQTNERLDQRFDLLSRRLVESETRTATALVDLAGAVREVKQLLSDRLDLRDRVDRCESEISRLKEHVGLDPTGS